MYEEGSGKISFFARTNFRNDLRLFGIRQKDRRWHMYVIGKTGTGKSTVLETLVRQDIAAGRGLALFDPHGDLVERLAARIPEKRQADTIYFNVPDSAHPMGFNPLRAVPPQERALAASGLLEVFKKIWAEFWGPRLEHILRNSLIALLDQSESTLPDILRLLGDADFRKSVAGHVQNPQVRQFWLREYEEYPTKFRAEAIAPIQNKVGAFLASPVLYRILTQKRSAFDLRQVMDEGKILLVNIAKGKIGEDTASLLGALLVSRIGTIALGRADTPEEDRRDFFLYLDEFQNYTSLSFANMISELRKYRVNLVLSHQYLSQIAPAVRDAILGNVGTMICFRVGLADAELLAKEFYPPFLLVDLSGLPNRHVYLKLMVKGRITQPFSAETVRFED